MVRVVTLVARFESQLVKADDAILSTGEEDWLQVFLLGKGYAPGAGH